MGLVGNIHGGTGGTGGDGGTGGTGPAGTGGTGGTGVGGNTWLSGAGIPTPDTIGVNGDYYLNTTNGDVWLKAGGTWV